MTVDEICREPERVIGTTVEVQGRFQGWQASVCRFSDAARTSPVTRGDWLIQNGTGCLYVTGGMPGGFDPASRADLGRSIEIDAMVMRDDSGKIYLSRHRATIR